MAGACGWDQGEGAGVALKSERISCFVSLLGAVVVVDVAFTGGA